MEGEPTLRKRPPYASLLLGIATSAGAIYVLTRQDAEHSSGSPTDALGAFDSLGKLAIGIPLLVVGLVLVLFAFSRWDKY